MECYTHCYSFVYMQYLNSFANLVNHSKMNKRLRKQKAINGLLVAILCKNQSKHGCFFSSAPKI